MSSNEIRDLINRIVDIENSITDFIFSDEYNRAYGVIGNGTLASVETHLQNSRKELSEVSYELESIYNLIKRKERIR